MPADSAPADRSVSNGSGFPNVATGASVSKLTAALEPASGTDADSVVLDVSSVADVRLNGPSAGFVAGGAACRAPLAGVTPGTEPGFSSTHDGSGAFMVTRTWARSSAPALPPACIFTESGCRSPDDTGRPFPSTTCTSQVPNV